MKFKNLLCKVGLSSLLIVLGHAQHVTDRSIYATDIKDKNGTTVFKFPTSAPSSNKAMVTNSNGEATASSVTDTELSRLSGVTSNIQTQLNSKYNGLPSQAGNAGKYLTTNGSAESWATVPTTSPGGSSTQVQYNDGGAFAGESNFIWDKVNKLLTVIRNSLGTSSQPAISVKNSTAATAGNQQVSPTIEVEGQGWKTNSTAGSQSVKAGYNVLPVQGAASPSAQVRYGYSINNGAYIYPMSLFSTSTANQPLWKFDGVGEISVNGSNTAPGTVDHLTLTNPSGGATHLSYKFGSNIKAAISAGSSGDLSYRTTSSNGHVFYQGGNINSQTLIAQIYSGGFYNNGGNFNQGKVTAGATQQNPPSTMNIYGGMTARTRYVEANYTATASDFALYCDTTNSSTCAGTPTACSTYTNSSTCNSHTAVGCNWQSQGNCGNANGTDQSTCEGQNAACSWESLNCSAFNDNPSGCSGAGFPSSQCSFSPKSCSEFFIADNPGVCPTGEGCSTTFSGNCGEFTTIATCDTKASLGCTTNTASCSAFDSDYGTCLATDGCTPNLGSCSDFNNNQSGCEAAAAPGCSYNTGDDTCSGTGYQISCSGSYFSSCTGNYYSSCDGTYSGSQGTCSGSYNTGNCNGGDYGICGGVANCGNLSLGSCTSEAGCSVTTGLDVNLPQISTVTDGLQTPSNSLILNIKKINSGAGSVTIKPNGSDTIQGSSSLSISSQWASVLLQAFTTPGQCSEFNNNQSSCGSHSGCGFTSATCGDFGADESTCNGASGCAWNSGNSTCEGIYTGSNGTCSGVYAKARTWMKWATQ